MLLCTKPLLVWPVEPECRSPLQVARNLTLLQDTKMELLALLLSSLSILAVSWLAEFASLNIVRSVVSQANVNG